MKRILVFLLIICATSCEYFSAKKISSQEIYEDEIKMINWNAVDTYPTFTSCDSFETKVEKKACFENTLSQHLTTSLQQEVITVSKNIEDTLMLEFQISETGEITIKNISISETTETEIPEIKNMIESSLNTLPQIFPAIKRNQQVKTEFKLPIVISVN